MWTSFEDEVPEDAPDSWDVDVPHEPESQGRVCHLRKRSTLRKALKVEVTVVRRDGTRHTLPALVDTGAKYNLCNPKCLETDQWEESPNPIVLLAVNESVVKGGNLELQTMLEVRGRTKPIEGTKTFTF